MKHELGEGKLSHLSSFPNITQHNAWADSAVAEQNIPKGSNFLMKIWPDFPLSLSLCMMNRRKVVKSNFSIRQKEKFIAQKLAFREKIIKLTSFQRMDSQLFYSLSSHTKGRGNIY